MVGTTTTVVSTTSIAAPAAATGVGVAVAVLAALHVVLWDEASWGSDLAAPNDA
jgi:hypothetical protein